MRHIFFLFIFATVTIILFPSFDSVNDSKHLFENDTTLLKKADKIIADADQLLPKAHDLKTKFAGYKLHALNCPKALREANDGLDMASNAVKDCEDAKALVEKARNAKKSKVIQKSIPLAEQKVHNAKYFIHEAEDRVKETEFELKGCHHQ